MTIIETQVLHISEQLRPGCIVWCKVMNPNEDHRSRGKCRPVVLVAREGGHWVVMGLTTNSTYSDGSPRVAIPAPSQVGLRPGFLWGSRLTRVCALDVYDEIGVCHASLAEAIIALAHLRGHWAQGLRLAASAPSLRY